MRDPLEIDERWPVLGSILETGRGAVLVVDDEPRPRERLVIRLLRAGFRVAAAPVRGVFDALCELEEAGEPSPFVVVRTRDERTIERLRRGPLRHVPGSRLVLVLVGEGGEPLSIRSEGRGPALEQVVLAEIEQRARSPRGGARAGGSSDPRG